MSGQYYSFEQERIYWMDALKGLGITVMVLGHMAITETLSGWINSFHMPMFFMISGFLYEKHKETNFWKFVRKKLETLIFPYICFSLISILFSCMKKLISPDSTSVAEVILQFLKGNVVESNLPLWYLTTLFFVTITFFLIAKWGEAIQVILILSGITIIVLAFQLPFRLERGIKGLIFYGTGWLMRCTYKWLKKEHGHYCFPDLLGGVTVMVGLSIWLIIIQMLNINGIALNIGNMETFNTLLLFPISLLGTAVFVGFARRLQYSELIRYLGAHSIVILCTHILVKDVLSVAIKIITHKSDGWIHQVNNLQSVILTIAILLLEIPIIYVIKKYLPFLIGKHKNK